MLCRGFTLLEILICVSVLSALAYFALPNLFSLKHAEDLGLLVQRYVRVLRTAQHVSLSLRTPVMVCPREADKTHQTPVRSPEEIVRGLKCATANRWHSGALVFVDVNNNLSFDRPDALLEVIAPLARGQALTWRSFGSRPYVRFLANGLTAWQNGRLTFCSAGATMVIVVNHSGRLYAESAKPLRLGKNKLSCTDL